MRTVENWQKNYRLKSLEQHCTARILHDFIEYNISDLPLGYLVRSTFLYGKVCTGKTIRAVQLLLAELRNSYIEALPTQALFICFTEMLSKIKESYNDQKITEKETIEKYMNVDLLVIDDFLTTKPTEWVIETLYRIINHRYENMKKTIITSNLSLPEIEERLQDQRITSRIDRMCVIEEKQKLY